uniref:Uncharacterized protein n=1 Tax=Romanomermis culicivorax TaxID=13658 RepID=A0A915KML6_ROMCU
MIVTSDNPRSPLCSHISATLNGLISIRAYGCQNDITKDFHRTGPEVSQSGQHTGPDSCPCPALQR